MLQLGQRFDAGKGIPDGLDAEEGMQMAQTVSTIKRLGKFYFAFFSTTSPSRESFAELKLPPTFNYNSAERYRTQESQNLGEAADLNACISVSVERKFVMTDMFINEVSSL